MQCSAGDLGCRMGQVEQMIRYAYWNSGCKGIVIGVSGGVDSAVAAAFCCRAVGPDKVLGLSLPSAVSYQKGLRGRSRTLCHARYGAPHHQHRADACRVPATPRVYRHPRTCWAT